MNNKLVSGLCLHPSEMAAASRTTGTGATLPWQREMQRKILLHICLMIFYNGIFSLTETGAEKTEEVANE
jgi:hypothetical protein